MPKLENIEPQKGGGGGFGAQKSAEEYKKNYGVIALTDIKNLKLLAKVPVYDEKAKTHDVVTFSEEDWDVIGYKGTTVGGAMQMFNRIFDTLEIPYVAQTGFSKGVEKTTRTIKQGKNVGQVKEQKVADILKVIRYGDEFDESRYATTRAGRPSYNKVKIDGKNVVLKDDKVTVNGQTFDIDGTEVILNKKKDEVLIHAGTVDHEDSPAGLVECLENWLTENVEKLDDKLITDLGLDRKMKEMELIE